MAREHGEAGAHRRHHAAADAPGDDPLTMPPLDRLCCGYQMLHMPSLHQFYFYP